MLYICQELEYFFSLKLHLASFVILGGDRLNCVSKHFLTYTFSKYWWRSKNNLWHGKLLGKFSLLTSQFLLATVLLLWAINDLKGSTIFISTGKKQGHQPHFCHL